MKHWTPKYDNSFEQNQIRLIDEGGDTRVISIGISDSGMIVFRERCDEFFYKEVTKDEAIEVLQEAIDWIKNETH